MSKVIGIVGSRRRCLDKDLKVIEQTFRILYKAGDSIVSGGCPLGADAFAEWIAKRWGIPIVVYKADWKGKGRSAGFQRNGLIAADADILIAAVSTDRTGGTEDTIRKFLKSNTSDNLYLV